MREWKRYVRRRLRIGELRGLRQERIVEELAGQLADLYEEARRAGASDREAERAAVEQVPDWNELAARIREAERPNEVSAEERRLDAATAGSGGGRSSSTRMTATGEPGRATAPAALADGSGEPRKLRRALGGLGADIRFSVRTLARRPISTAVALVTLALGLGATVAIFSVVHGVLLAPLPYSEPDRLVVMNEQTHETTMSVAYPNFLDWRSGNRAFDAMAAYNWAHGLGLAGFGEPLRVDAVRMSASMFDVLRVEPALGRRFRPEDDRVGAERVTIVSHAFWQDRLGGDRGVVGKTISLDGQAYVVVGVMPRGFVFPLSLEQPALVVPIELFAERWITQRTNHPGITVLARLRPGVTLDRGREDMERVAVRLEAEFPDSNKNARVRAMSLHERTTRRTRTPLLLLVLAVACLLLIACANVANLLLARAATRQREIAVRAALGAGSGRLVRLLIVESLIVWLAGGVLGLVFALGGSVVLGDRIGALLPRAASSPLDLRVAAAGLALSLATGALFGLVPALRSAGTDLRAALESATRTGSRLGHHVRDLLIVGEVALAIVLLVGSGLAIRSLRNVLRADLGFDPEHVLTAAIDLPAARYREPTRRIAFFDGLRERLGAQPGIEGVATTYVLPMAGGGWQNTYHVEGQPAVSLDRAPYAEVSAVSPGYFRAMGIRLVRGRDFDARDRAGSPPVAVVDERWVARYWPGQDGLGNRLKFGGHDSKAPWMEVVGVVAPVRLQTADAESELQFYIPHAHDNDLACTLVVRTSVDPSAIGTTIRRAVLALDPAQPVSHVQRLVSLVQATTGRRSVPAAVVSFFAASASILAAVGVFGVMSSVTGERRREMGVRMALGARAWQVRAMIVGQAMARVAVGAGLGLGGALALGVLIRGWLFGVSPFDPASYVSACAMLGLASLVAAFVPARRATRMDVARVLQSE